MGREVEAKVNVGVIFMELVIASKEYNFVCLLIYPQYR